MRVGLSGKKILILGIIVILLVSLGMAIYVTQQEQDIRQEAADPAPASDAQAACLEKTAINLVIDKSLSMGNSNKMTVLRNALGQFVNYLGTVDQDFYIGMDVFGAPNNPPGGAFTELNFVKYADNKALIASEINSLSVGVGGGTYMRKGFETAIAKINAAKAKPELAGYKFVTIVFSDGVPEVQGHSGSSQCLVSSGQNGEICFARAQDPRNSPSRVDQMKQITDGVYSVVIYSDNPTSRDYPLRSHLIKLMQDVSDDPDSKYYFDATTSDVGELNTIFQTLPEKICETTPTPSPTKTPTPTIQPSVSPTPTPTIPACPVPEQVTNIRIECPFCDL